MYQSQAATQGPSGIVDIVVSSPRHSSSGGNGEKVMEVAGLQAFGATYFNKVTCVNSTSCTTTGWDNLYGTLKTTTIASSNNRTYVGGVGTDGSFWYRHRYVVNGLAGAKFDTWSPAWTSAGGKMTNALMVFNGNAENCVRVFALTAQKNIYFTLLCDGNVFGNWALVPGVQNSNVARIYTSTDGKSISVRYGDDSVTSLNNNNIWGVVQKGGKFAFTNGHVLAKTLDNNVNGIGTDNALYSFNGSGYTNIHPPSIADVYYNSKSDYIYRTFGKDVMLNYNNEHQEPGKERRMDYNLSAKMDKIEVTDNFIAGIANGTISYRTAILSKFSVNGRTSGGKRTIYHYMSFDDKQSVSWRQL